MRPNKSERRHTTADSSPHPKLTNPRLPDFRVLNEGTISRFCLLTDACRAWVREHITLELWQSFGNLEFAAEHRLVGNLVVGAINDGLTLETV